MNAIPAPDRVKTTIVKVLGMQWHTDTDRLQLPGFEMPPTAKVTKKSQLSLFARVYDPLGLAIPITLRARTLFQHTCELKLGWTDTVPAEIAAEFEDLVQQFRRIPQITVARFVGTKDSIPYLHCFVDASDQAYAAVVYATMRNSNPKTSLIYAKSRVRPLQKITIPRMELVAALIGARAINFVRKQLEYSGPVYLWSDSQIVFSWIKSQKPQTAFLENRLKEIRKTTNTQFRYVGTRENPADLATRPQGIDSLDSFWWNGPFWLNGAPDTWPNWQAALVEVPDTETGLVAEQNFDHPEPIDISKFASLTKLLRVTARCKAHIHRISRKTANAAILVSDLKDSLKLWLLHVQNSTYSELINCIIANKKHPLIGQLGVHQDTDKILRCRGRLSKMSTDEDTKNPILLPFKHPFTDLVIREYHEKLQHVGVSQVLGAIRLSYWIPKGRSRMQVVLRRCPVCRKANGPSYRQPDMPPLPYNRVNQAAPFEHTALDYFGPLFVKTESGQRKTWIALFTCMTVRAIHLELVPDMTAEQFLLAFRRFVATYGCPSTVFCDNAPTFKAVASAYDDMWAASVRSQVVDDYTTSKGIKWTYITPHAPWMGGVFERMVQVVKRVLRKTLGRAKLTPSQLSTVLKECQEVVNDRPLTFVGSDISDLKILRPIDILMPLRKRGGPVGNIICADVSGDYDYIPTETTTEQLSVLWKKGQNLVQQFWQAWHNEYLLALREKQRWVHKQPRSHAAEKPSVGAIVLIKQDQMPRSRWKLAKIVELKQSEDKAVRTAIVVLPDGQQVARSVKQLFPIEVASTAQRKDNRQNNTESEDNSTQSTAADPNSNTTAANTTATQQTPQAASSTRTRRQAFTRARQQIQQQLESDED